MVHAAVLHNHPNAEEFVHGVPLGPVDVGCLAVEDLVEVGEYFLVVGVFLFTDLEGIPQHCPVHCVLFDEGIEVLECLAHVINYKFQWCIYITDPVLGRTKNTFVGHLGGKAVGGRQWRVILL